MNRADWREPIFLEDADRQMFLETLAEASQNQLAYSDGVPYGITK